MKIENWTKFSIPSLEIVYKEAKERFEENISESEILTNRAEKFITGTLAVYTYFFGFLFKDAKDLKCVHWVLFVIICFATITVLYNGFKLLAPKNIIYRGIDPSSFKYEIFEGDSEENTTKGIIVSCIYALYDYTHSMSEKNAARQVYYNNCIILLVTQILSVGAFAITLYQS